jgi:multidrug efflux system membrane fusion protein
VSIETGLAPGEQVVVDGADKLREGAKVEPTSKYATPSGGGGGRKGGGAGDERRKAPGSTANAAPGTAAAVPAREAAAPGGGQALSAEERQKRWAEMNARIDRGEFGEEIRKLPEEERKLRMRELRGPREAGGPGAPAGPAAQK